MTTPTRPSSRRATLILRTYLPDSLHFTDRRTQKGKLPAHVGHLAEVLARGDSRPPTPALPRKGGGRKAQPSPEREAMSSRARPLSARGKGGKPRPPPRGRRGHRGRGRCPQGG